MSDKSYGIMFAMKRSRPNVFQIIAAKNPRVKQLFEPGLSGGGATRAGSFSVERRGLTASRVRVLILPRAIVYTYESAVERWCRVFVWTRAIAQWLRFLMNWRISRDIQVKTTWCLASFNPLIDASPAESFHPLPALMPFPQSAFIPSPYWCLSPAESFYPHISRSAFAGSFRRRELTLIMLDLSDSFVRWIIHSRSCILVGS